MQARELNVAHSAAQAALAAELDVARRQRADADERAAALEAQARLPCQNKSRGSAVIWRVMTPVHKWRPAQFCYASPFVLGSSLHSHARLSLDTAG